MYDGMQLQQLPDFLHPERNYNFTIKFYDNTPWRAKQFKLATCFQIDNYKHNLEHKHIPSQIIIAFVIY